MPFAATRHQLGYTKNAFATEAVFLAGFEGPLWGEKKKGGKEAKEKDGRKHPSINFWLRPCARQTELAL